MTEKRIEQFPIRNFEYLFSPPGLPLVLKGRGAIGTTSLLIRGGAGAGKTTLAAGVAHAIARENGGLVLYVTTEFSPVEITYKARLLGLSNGSVHSWPGVPGLPPGALVVHHLGLVDSYDDAGTTGDKKRGAIDAVWELIHGEESRPPLPIRAVVIDAFALPDGTEDEPALRSDLIKFIQALESEGISTVLVEELAPGADAWTPFVVDIVCEIRFAEDSETSELRRKLACTKSRYAVALPGPHDYGLHNKIPCVWPDLLRVTKAPHGQISGLTRINPLRIAVPTAPDRWVHLAGGIVISAYEKINLHALNLIHRTPGAVRVSVQCGSETHMIGPGGALTSPDDEGPHSIGWSILEVARSADGIFCVILDIEELVARAGWRVPVLHMLTALRDLGMLVVIHGELERLTTVQSSANLIWRVGKWTTREPRPRRHRSVARLLVSPHRTWPQANFNPERDVHDVTPGCEVGTSEVLSTQRTALLARLKSNSLTGREPRMYHDALAADAMGMHGAFVGRLRDIANAHYSSEPFFPLAIWLGFGLGAEWYAANAVFEVMGRDAGPEPLVQLLWAAICATQADNLAAIEVLKAKLHQPEDHLVLDPLIRSLAATGRVPEADAAILHFAERHELEAWIVDRLLADARLDARDLAVVRDGEARLEKLATDARLPLVHQAEVCHNLGVAKDRLGEREASVRSFWRAIELNPYLEAAHAELTKLDVTPPTPPSV